MKKITEAELSRRVSSLREKLVLESTGEVDEAWYDPSSWGKPDYKATAAVNGKNSQRNYNAALAQIKSLYAAAGVTYPPQDKIVQQRFGLPDPLPATAAEWDGTMPNAGQADYLTRNVFGRDGSAKAGDVNTANNAASVKQAAHDTLVDSKVAELKKAVNSLLALIGTSDSKTGGAAGGGTIGSNFDAGNAPIGANGMPMQAVPMDETMSRLRNLIAEADAPRTAAQDAQNDVSTSTGSAAVTPASDKAALIKQCQALMAELNSLEENPDQDVLEALQNAQAAIDQAAKTPDPAPAEPTGAVATPVPDQNIINGSTLPPLATPVADPAQDAQGFGQAFRAARNLQMKKDPENPGGGIFTWNGKQYNTQQKNDAGGAPVTPVAPAAPAKKDIEPSQFTNVPYPPTPRPMNVKPLPGRVQEAVNYADDQTLARIVSLGRR